MLQRQTQTAAFWRDQFEISANDLDYLYDLLLEAQQPLTLDALAGSLIREYQRRENAKIEQELAKGEIYLPKAQHAVGQKIVFPVLDFAVGEVVEVREGQNPEHGEFNVITVQFADSGQTREFASNLASPHRLNQSDGVALVDKSALLSDSEIYSLYAAEIDESLLFALEESERSSQFVHVEGAWMLADMLAEVHVGHLNIAEALIEMAGQPISTQQLISEVDLDENVGEAMRIISLNHALLQDKRFDRVQSEGEQRWFLTRLEPAIVIESPIILRNSTYRYNRALLSVELLQLEWELDDEWGESSLSSEVPNVVPNTSLTLTYPHRRYGTLPLNGRTRSFFPTATAGHSLVTLVDGRWGTHFPGWVSHERRYISGLEKWMEDHVLPVGAFITLERTANPYEIVVDYRTRRAKREWARIATADLETQQLLFQMNKVQVACEYDEYLIVAESDPGPVDELRRAMREQGVELAEIVDRMVPELTKLSPQGTVHAKSVYSAVNMLRRSPPGPVFYTLISNRRFRDVGGGFFALA